MTMRILSANDLESGLVIYCAADGRWTGDPSRAAVAGRDVSPEWLEARLEDAIEGDRVVAPVIVEAEWIDGAPVPLRLRERIRSAGPTVAYAGTAAPR